MRVTAVHEIINPSKRVATFSRAIGIDNAVCQVKTSRNDCRHANGAGQASDVVFSRVVGLEGEDGTPQGEGDHEADEGEEHVVLCLVM